MKKFRVQATQKMRFDEILVKANSKEEAEQIYNDKWNNGGIYSVDYDEDSVKFEIFEE